MNGGSISGSGRAEYGGALLISGKPQEEAATEAELTDVEIYNTRANRGGGVAIRGGHVHIANALFSGCQAVASQGVRTANGVGGAFFMEEGVLELENCRLSGCRAEASGGALYMEYGTAKIRGGSITECSAVNGNAGGIYAESGTLMLDGTQFSRCTASGVENGLYVRDAEVSSRAV